MIEFLLTVVAVVLVAWAMRLYWGQRPKEWKCAGCGFATKYPEQLGDPYVCPECAKALGKP